LQIIFRIFAARFALMRVKYKFFITMRFIVSTTALSCKLAALSKVVNSGINLNTIYKAFESANVDADSSVFQVILERIGRIPVSRQKYEVDRIIKREIIKEKKRKKNSSSIVYIPVSVTFQQHSHYGEESILERANGRGNEENHSGEPCQHPQTRGAGEGTAAAAGAERHLFRKRMVATGGAGDAITSRRLYKRTGGRKEKSRRRQGSARSGIPCSSNW